MNRNHAIMAAELSELAYEDELAVADTFREYRYIDNGTVQGFVGRLPSLICIVFRGTDANIRDWIINLDVRKRKAPGFLGKVHEGFYNAMFSVHDEVDAAVRELKHRGDHILIAGHSQGAALAALYAAKSHSWDNENVPVIHLFGCPRVGNAQFAHWFDELFRPHCYRWVKNNDIVPRVPIAVWGWLFRFLPFLHFLPSGFRHFGKLCYLNVCGHLNRHPTRFQLFKDRLAGRILHAGKLLTDGIEDHSMSQYRRDVTKNIRR